MKVFLLKDVEKVGLSGEIIKVSEGYAANFLIPRKLAIEVTEKNALALQNRIKVVEKREEVIQSKTSMLAERIKSLKLSIKRKAHDDGKLYGSISQSEVVDLLAAQGISLSKAQVEFSKAIKTVGNHEVGIKLTSKLQTKLTLTVVAE